MQKLKVFQSLLSWKYNQISQYPRVEKRRLLVSILVILEIQSDLDTINKSATVPNSFNPCYLGNTIRSLFNSHFEISLNRMFQSLLSWKYNQICILLCNHFSFRPPKFQSLLSWKYNQIWVNVSALLVSLVLFQSLLSWKYNQIALYMLFFQKLIICFNPCYLGNTIRSVNRKTKKVNRIKGFNPCYLGNTIRSAMGHCWSCIIGGVSILVILEIQSDRHTGPFAGSF